MLGHDIVVIGASAGGVEALVKVVQGLPAGLPAAVFVVLHMPPTSRSMLAHILERSGRLPAETARDGERIESGRIYVAPPDHHLLIRRGYMRVLRGPQENGHRPAIDPLFRSAALAYGSRVIGVVLSGALDDGTAGLVQIKRRGGVALAQQPADALYPSMPESACANVDVDLCLPALELGPAIAKLAGEPVPPHVEPDAGTELEQEVEMAELDPPELQDPRRAGSPSGLTCPLCHGALWELNDGQLIHFRCRVGHAYAPEGLDTAQSESVETAFWIALRALEEKAALAGRLMARAQAGGHDLAMARFDEQEREARAAAETIRTVLLRGHAQSSRGNEEAPGNA